VVTGEASSQTVHDYLVEILKVCRDRGCRRILIEERLTGPRLKPLEILQVLTEISDLVHGDAPVTAFVDIYAEGDLMQFAEDVAVNRGLFGKVFTTVAEAERWIAQEP
jgi:hypothetical protein